MGFTLLLIQGYKILFLSFSKYTHGYVWRPDEGVRSPCTGVTGGYKLPDKRVGNWVQIFWKVECALNHQDANPFPAVFIFIADFNQDFTHLIKN